MNIEVYMGGDLQLGVEQHCTSQAKENTDETPDVCSKVKFSLMCSL